MINAVIDLSHHNKLSSVQKLAASGVKAVIHKATQGTSFVYPTFSANRAKIESAGLLFGASHFAVAGEARAQAEHFLSIVGTRAVLVVDFGPNPQGKDVSLEEAEELVHYIFNATGMYPGLYSGHTIKERLLKVGINQPSQTELSKCWLWIAQYSSAPIIPKVWDTWHLWQYTDGAAGKPPYIANGVGRCDRNMFNGNNQELEDFWAVHTIET